MHLRIRIYERNIYFSFLFPEEQFYVYKYVIIKRCTVYQNYKSFKLEELCNGFLGACWKNYKVEMNLFYKTE